MGRLLKDGLVGLAVGLLGGAIAGILLAPKRSEPVVGGEMPRPGSVLDTLLDGAQSIYEGAQALLGRSEGLTIATGILPDERVSMRIRAELERLGIWSSRLDVTTVDGEVYLRGSEPDAARAATIVATVGEVVGVSNVVDELRRA